MQKNIKMPKRVGHLFEKMLDIDVIMRAIRKASEKKRNQRNVKRILDNIEKYAKRIRQMIREGSFKPSPYKMKEINDGIRLKKRLIAKPRFYPDQCVHHVLIIALQPIIMRSMYYYSCGSVPGKGGRLINKGILKFIRRHNNKAKYVLKMDIRHFYETVTHESLMQMLRRKIKDKSVLNICNIIVRSYPGGGKCCGVPIGNFTSPWFTNLLLEPVDHAIKHYLGKDYFYSRYVDDMVIIGPNKRKLHKLRKTLEVWLSRIELRLKGNYQVYKLSKRCIDFVGVKYFKDGHTEIRKSVLKRIKRKARKIGRLGYINARNAMAMVSYMGRVHHTDSEHLFQKHIKPYIGSTKKLRRIISYEAKLCGAAG